MSRKIFSPFEEVRTRKRLKDAWNKVYKKAIFSDSREIKQEAINFKFKEDTFLNRISRKLRSNCFEFKGSKGIILNERPIVIAPIECRVVQRSILDVLQAQASIQKYLEVPTSFGAIQSKKDDDNQDIRKGVPPAIEAVVKSIQNGATYYYKSDIKSFFTQIRRDEVILNISTNVSDKFFIDLLKNSTNLEIENLQQLGEYKAYFDFSEIGVPQGCCLSPLLGNILLFEFDYQMNQSDITCLRYLDDFIILGPNEIAVKAAFKRAIKLLKKYDLEAYEVSESRCFGKAQIGRTINKFDFLGIEIHGKKIRPAKSARNKLLQEVDEILKKRIPTKQLNFEESRYSLLDVLLEVHRKIKSWGNQYYFCNDKSILGSMDNEINEKLRQHFHVYRRITNKLDWQNKRRYLGIHLLLDSKKQSIIF